MHAVVMERLENYLSGLLEPAEEREIEAHLEGCAACREELCGMQSISGLFGSLRPVEAGSKGEEEAPVPAPGFYVRVMQEVEARKAKPSFSGIFSFDFAFGRRLVVSSLVTLVLMSGWLVSRETGYAAGISAETILAQQDTPGFDTASGPENMLATLTTYGH